LRYVNYGSVPAAASLKNCERGLIFVRFEVI
jgi:hypothetical protein